MSGLQLEIEANFTFDKVWQEDQIREQLWHTLPSQAAASQRFGISVRMSLDGSMRTDILFVHQVSATALYRPLTGTTFCI